MASLKELQSLPLRVKIDYSKGKIEEFVEELGGWENVYISFSGGKDSTVLCEIVRGMNPDVKMMFVNTGMEFPEIIEFVKEKRDVYGWNIDITNPKMYFKDVIKKYGYPVISKEQAQYIDQWRNAKSLKTKFTRWHGNKWGMGKISEKWKKTAWDNNFKISDKCCDVMKKEPAKRYEKQSKRFPIIGTMADESKFRQQQWVRFGCNSFDTKRIISKPLSIWKEQDIWNYIKENNVEIAKPYKMGYKRTGCTMCLFGCHLENKNGSLNRIQRLEKTHPKLWQVCMSYFGFYKICKELGIPTTADDIKWYLEENITCKEQKNLF